MAPQTSTYHLQNEKHSQLHLYNIPYWPKVNLEIFIKKQKNAPTKSEPAVRRCQKRSKRSPLQNGKGPYRRSLEHCCSTKWVSISTVDGRDFVEETWGGILLYHYYDPDPGTSRLRMPLVLYLFAVRPRWLFDCLECHPKIGYALQV